MKYIKWHVVLSAVLICSVLSAAPVNAEGYLTSTYFGGSHREWGFLQASVLEAPDGTLYVATPSKSLDYPVPVMAYQTVPNGQFDILIARFSSDLTQLLAATYIGGSSGETLGRNQAMQIDDSGNIFLIFETASDDLPASPSAYSTVLTGSMDAAVAKFDANLENLLALTYLGGTDFETVSDVRLTADDSLLVSGWTRSSDFPVTHGAYDESFNGTGPYIWGGDLFVSRFDENLQQLEASTFLGGSGWEYGGCIELDSDGYVVITTATASTDYPVTLGAYDTEHAGNTSGTGSDIAVSRLNADLTALLHSTFVGGSLDDWGYALTISPAGDIYVTGHTSSEDYPVSSGCYDSSFNGISGVDQGDDVPLTRLSSNLDQLLASTYIGGTHWDCANWLEVMADGTVFVAGHAASTDFPVTAGTFQPFHAGGSTAWEGDVFIGRFDNQLTQYQAGSLFGGTGMDGVGAGCVTVDTSVVVCGFTKSEDLPGCSTGFDPEYNTGAGSASQGDCFVLRVDPDLIGVPVPTPTPSPSATPTATATPGATATPATTWYELSMVDTELVDGDLFQLTRHCGNPGDRSLSVDEYVILDIMGAYWYWPDWTQSVNWQRWSLDPGSNVTEVLMEFTWPDVDGSLAGIRFWGAFLHENSSQLISYTWIDWSYREE